MGCCCLRRRTSQIDLYNNGGKLVPGEDMTSNKGECGIADSGVRWEKRENRGKSNTESLRKMNGFKDRKGRQWDSASCTLIVGSTLGWLGPGSGSGIDLGIGLGWVGFGIRGGWTSSLGSAISGMAITIR
jgi:hypothetical protein